MLMSTKSSYDNLPVLPVGPREKRLAHPNFCDIDVDVLGWSVSLAPLVDADVDVPLVRALLLVSVEVVLDVDVDEVQKP